MVPRETFGQKAAAVKSVAQLRQFLCKVYNRAFGQYNT
jgi:hypothetical protein